MKKSRVLFIGGYPNPANENLYVFFRNLVHAMADNGVECYVISPVSVTKYKGDIEKIPEHNTEHTSKGSSIEVYYPRHISFSAINILGIYNTMHLTQASYNKAAYKAAKRTGLSFDAVYGHFFVSGGLAAAYVGKRMQLPAFVANGESSYQALVVKRFGKVGKKYTDHITGIVSVSSKNLKELEETGLYKNIPVLMCPNAVDMGIFKEYDKKDSRSRLGIPQDKFTVGFVGTFCNRKGDKRLLEACEGIPDIQLAFAGRGEDKPEGGNVVFCRSVPHDDIPEFLSAVDAFALPTLNEGCCNAVLEAMAAGLPIVSSDLPFNDDILNTGNSIRIDPMSIEDIRTAVLRIKNDNDLRQKLGKNAKSDAAGYTIEARASRIYDFMKECISNG